MRVRTCLLVFFLAWILSACSPSSFQSKTLRLAFHSMPTTLDPRRSGDFISSTLICLLYEGLTRNISGGGVEPALAYKIEISPDRLVYTFHLRKTYWTDGHPVTAQDFERSWKTIIDPSFPSLCAYLLFPIKNAEKCAKGEVSPAEVAIQAIDPWTLRVELEQPTPYFLDLTAFPLFLPIPSHLDTVSSKESLVSNGPFRIHKIVTNSAIHLVKNPSFWNRNLSSLNDIRIAIIPDENTTLQLFEQGELDWIGSPLSSLPLDSIPFLLKKGQLSSVPMDASTLITFNIHKFPFHNQKLRKALSMALDRNKLAHEIAEIHHIPAERCLPPSLYDQAARPLKSLFSSSPEPSTILFAQALEELSLTPSDLESFTLFYKMGEMEKRVAQALQKEWKETLGFMIKIEGVDPGTHIHRLHKREYEIALGCWIAQIHDPINILERYRLPSNPKNFPGWENAKYINLLEQASSTLDKQVRLNLLEQAEEILADEMPIAPLYHWTGTSISHPRCKNIATTPSGGILFERFNTIPSSGL